MGVPKFYRWISERYPCLSEIVKESQIPEFDNLYLDMNGIIHTCSHPNDDDPHFRITEEQIFRDIFRYIEVLFRIIRPRKVFFMAVDGVAPRAKMNQQRGRRFMSARTAEELIEQAKKKGETLPTEERFDSNCITPGTVFMARLHEQLKYFVNMKVTTDDMWQGIRIYLSGHDVPGEGEHKIMDFIRYERSQPGYDCNTRHCLYGLDADLIMLGMCSHEPYFALLREEVKFVRPTKKSSHRTSNAEQTTFHLLHLSLLRDYIELEFGAVKEKLSFDFDLESIIDDWVLMGFLVGNDFIPHLPNLHIHANALPTLYKAYKAVLPELGGYINENGFLNLARFEKFMTALSQFDRDNFEDEYEDYKWLESKSCGVHFGSRDIRKNVPRYIVGGGGPPKKLVPYTDSEPEGAGGESSGGGKSPPSAGSAEKKGRSGSSDSEDISHLPDELQDLIRRSNAVIKNSETSGEDEEEDVQEVAVEMKAPTALADYDCGDEEDDSESWSPDMEKRFKEFKSDYYMNKLRFDHVTPEVLHDQAVQYVRAIQWNLHYYYNGIASWSWYYPHHYAPYLSDVKGFSNLDINFELGEPFLPFQQLLAVLPAASRKLLPTAYQSLMTDSESPLIDFYPSEFSTDLNGKKNDWEAVILIPFIEEQRLLRSMTPRSGSLTDEEKARNRPGKHLLYTTAAQDQGFYRTPLMGVFPDLEHNKAICTQLDMAIFRLPPSKIRKGLLPGVRLDMYFLGFSTLKHLPYVGELMSANVKVFEQQSKNESIFIKLLEDPRSHQPLADLAMKLLDKEIYINWPHLTIGRISAVSSGEEKYVKQTDTGEVKPVAPTAKEVRTWREHAEEIKTKYAQHRAVDIGEVWVLVYVTRLMGTKVTCNQRGQVALEKQWGDISLPYALQTLVENVNVRDSMLSGKFSSVDQMFPVGSKVFLTKNPHYGCQGTVVNPFNPEDSRFRVEVIARAEPDFSRLKANQERIGLYWFPGWQAAQRLDVSGHFLSRITGTVYVTENPPSASASGSNSSGNRYNIGLNLKFSKKNEEVPDYTKRDADGVWLYSSKVLKILGEYIEKFPEVCDFLHSNDGGRDVYSADDFWDPTEAKEKLSELVEWLKALPCYGAQHQATGTECIDERVIRVMENAVEQTKRNSKNEMKLVAVRPNALFRSCLSEGNAPADPQADFQLFDRVVCAREGFTVPVGLRGTVVGIHPERHEGDSKLSVIFDDEFIGGIVMRNSKCSGYHIMASALINLSYGVRLAEEKKKGKYSGQEQQQQQQHHHGWAYGTPYPATSSVPYGQYMNERKDERNAPHRPTQNRRPVALQTAPPQAPSGQVAVVSKSAHSAFQIAERAGGATAHHSPRPVLQKSMSENHTASSSKTVQGGKSIMNELFPNRIAEEPKPGEVVFVNSNVKKEKKKDLEESSRALRSLLHVGETKETEPKKRSETKDKRNRKSSREEQRQQTPQAPKSQEPRVPFTARQPQPPPFAPVFSPDASPIAVVPPSRQELQQQPSQPDQPPPITAFIPPTSQKLPAPLPMQLFQQPPPVPTTVAAVGHNLGQQQAVRPMTVPVQIVPPMPQIHQQVQQQFVGQMHPMAPQPTMLPPTGPIQFNQIILPNAIPVGQQPNQQQQQQWFQAQQQKFQQLQQIQLQQLQNLQRYQQQQLQQGPAPPMPQQAGPIQHQALPHQQQQLHHNQHQQQQPKLQQQHYQHHHGGGPAQGRQRRTSNSAGGGGHEQFVPMQVTKKQPAPAYVKNIAAKAVAETEKSMESPKVENQNVPTTGQSASATAAVSGEKGPKSESTVTGGSKPRQQGASNAAARPKSRLAIKLANAPAN